MCECVPMLAPDLSNPSATQPPGELYSFRHRVGGAGPLIAWQWPLSIPLLMES